MMFREELFAGKIQRKGMYPSNVVTRKANYEEAVSNFTSIELSAFKWEFEFPEYLYDWALNLEFNFLINLELSIDFGIDLGLETFLDYLDFEDLFNLFDKLYDEFNLVFEFPFELKFEEIEKAYYGKTKYGYSYYDPPRLNATDVLKFAWYIRNKYLTKIGYDYKYTKEAMKKIIEAEKSVITSMGLNENVAEYVIRRILLAEAKLLNSAYVGLAIVDLAPVSEFTDTPHAVSKVVARNAETFEPILEAETNSPYDTNVDYAIVGFSRVSLPAKMLYASSGCIRNNPTTPVEILEVFGSAYHKGRLELSTIDIHTEYGKLSLMPGRMFLHESSKKKALRGGKHQAIIHDVMLFTSRVCNKHGIVGYERMTYQNFAIELKYLKHNGIRKAKTWKDDASVDMLIEKYVNIGCEREILEEIAKYVVPYTEKNLTP